MRDGDVRYALSVVLYMLSRCMLVCLSVTLEYPFEAMSGVSSCLNEDGNFMKKAHRLYNFQLSSIPSLSLRLLFLVPRTFLLS